MVLKVSADVVDIGEFCCVFAVHIYIYSAGYVQLPIVLLYLLRCFVYHMLSKTRTKSRSLHRVIAYIYVRLVMPSYVLFCLVHHMLSKTRTSVSSYRVR